jgi:hypothetical protein
MSLANKKKRKKLRGRQLTRNEDERGNGDVAIQIAPTRKKEAVRIQTEKKVNTQQTEMDREKPFGEGRGHEIDAAIRSEIAGLTCRPIGESKN